VKSRNREINIFNMSLLDILCGALGTFCFLMLTLLPYYSPNSAGPRLANARRELEALKAAKEEKQSAGKARVAPFLIAGAVFRDPKATARLEIDSVDAETRKRIYVSRDVRWRTLLMVSNMPPGNYPLYFVPEVVIPGGYVAGFICDRGACFALPSYPSEVLQPSRRVPAGSITVLTGGRIQYQKPQ